MIFTSANCQAILEGKKTQTRRPQKEGEWLYESEHAGIVTQYVGAKRLRWQTGKSYAIQTGRGKKGIGWLRFTRFELQHLQDITEEDAIAEGFGMNMRHWMWGDTPQTKFRTVWDSIYKRQPELQWSANPKVWVLHFELVK